MALALTGAALGTPAFVPTSFDTESALAVLDASLASTTPTSISVTVASGDDCAVNASTHAVDNDNGLTVKVLSYTGAAACSEITPAIYLQSNLQWCSLTSNCNDSSSWLTEITEPSEIVSCGTQNILPTYHYDNPSPGDWRELLNWTFIEPGGTEDRGALPSNIVYAPY